MTDRETLNPASSKRHLDKSVLYAIGSGHGMVPPKSAFLSADFSAIAHATEDIDKVEQAVRSLVAWLSRSKVNLTRQYVKGHHGNVITTISAKLSGKELYPEALTLLSQKLSESDRRFLFDHVQSCVDQDRNLYLRFDKQEAFFGSIRLHEGDPIRAKFKFASMYDVERIVSFCKESGLIL